MMCGESVSVYVHEIWFVVVIMKCVFCWYAAKCVRACVRVKPMSRQHTMVATTMISTNNNQITWSMATLQAILCGVFVARVHRHQTRKTRKYFSRWSCQGFSCDRNIRCESRSLQLHRKRSSVGRCGQCNHSIIRLLEKQLPRCSFSIKMKIDSAALKVMTMHPITYMSTPFCVCPHLCVHAINVCTMCVCMHVATLGASNAKSN